MKGSITKSVYSETALNPAVRDRYETGNSGAWKNGISSLMIELKEVEIKADAIPVHMKHGQTETKNLKDKGEIPTGTVHVGKINKTTTLPLPTEESWSQDTSEDHDLGYIKRILSSPEETTIYPKELRNKGCVKPFQKGRLELDNVLISYYYTPKTAIVRQLRLIMVPVKLR